MRPDAIELDETHHERTGAPVAPTPVDRDGVALALVGGSVLDWSGLSFQTYEEVNAFLRLWHCDITQHAWARERLRYVYNQAVEYLEEHLGLTFSEHVRRPHDVREAFLAASQRGRFSRDRIQFCAILKLMHVINHLEMQELRSQLPIRDVELQGLARRIVETRATQMYQEGFPLYAFYGSFKTRPSVISKLLAKREATAATIYDKLRFRVVTERREHIVPAIAWLLRNLVPFPAIIPGESHNNLLTADEILAATQAMPELTRIFPGGLASIQQPVNPHSTGVFRTINFVVDLPAPVYELPNIKRHSVPAILGMVVPVLVEFQILDVETDRNNEGGESRHELYKARQIEAVHARLGRSGALRRRR